MRAVHARVVHARTVNLCRSRVVRESGLCKKRLICEKAVHVRAVHAGVVYVTAVVQLRPGTLFYSVPHPVILILDVIGHHDILHKRTLERPDASQRFPAASSGKNSYL